MLCCLPNMYFSTAYEIKICEKISAVECFKGYVLCKRIVYNVMPHSLFSPFKFCQTSLLTMKKPCPLFFFFAVLSICLSVCQLGPSLKKLNRQPSVVSWTQWSQHFILSVNEGKWTKGTCRCNLTSWARTCPSFSIFCHNAVSEKVIVWEGESQLQLPTSSSWGRVTDSQSDTLSWLNH